MLSTRGTQSDEVQHTALLSNIIAPNVFSGQFDLTHMGHIEKKM